MKVTVPALLPIVTPANAALIVMETDSPGPALPEAGETVSQGALDCAFQLEVPVPVLVNVKVCAVGSAPPTVPLKPMLPVLSERAVFGPGDTVKPTFTIRGVLV